MPLQKITELRHWYEKNETKFTTGSLLLGFIFDSLTLQRVDALGGNLWLLANLVIVAVCIIIINRGEVKPSFNVEGEEKRVENPADSGTWKYFWLFNLLQFGFGAMLGGFFVLYFQSSALATAWPFLLILLAAMVANELFQKRYARLTFQLSFFYLSLFSFTIFIVPLLIHRIGAWVFLISGAVSLGVMYLYARALKRFTKKRFLDSRIYVQRSIAMMFITVNVLYFMNLIPPIPLSLKDAGIYHSIGRTGGSYEVQAEEKGILDFFRLQKKVHIVSGQKLYAYSAIYSPPKLDLNVVHEWQYKNKNGEWVTASRIPLHLAGGRPEGFRTYSEKSNLTPGDWRVNIGTYRGQLIGRISFEVIPVSSRPVLETEVKE